ncbi:hypothetical protein O3P69_000580 [Scylla paramamosain]|uniref:Secreted protein n=1 Tax=Scylla paramamosain TaxID=85552 RepID=A0AAW0UQ45_SCYPA
MALRLHASVALWFYFSMTLWSYGSVVLWFYDFVVLWLSDSILPCLSQQGTPFADAPRVFVLQIPLQLLRESLSYILLWSELSSAVSCLQRASPATPAPHRIQHTHTFKMACRVTSTMQKDYHGCLMTRARQPAPRPARGGSPQPSPYRSFPSKAGEC